MLPVVVEALGTQSAQGVPKLKPKDVSDTLMFILGVPGHVQVREVILDSVGALMY